MPGPGEQRMPGEPAPSRGAPALSAAAADMCAVREVGPARDAATAAASTRAAPADAVELGAVREVGRARDAAAPASTRAPACAGVAGAGTTEASHGAAADMGASSEARTARDADAAGSARAAAGRRAEEVARASYGRLVAVLAAPTRDLAAAEDALADAFEAALTTWPERGIPQNPEGWLLTVARNRLRDLWKSAAWRLNAGSTSIDERERERERELGSGQGWGAVFGATASYGSALGAPDTAKGSAVGGSAAGGSSVGGSSVGGSSVGGSSVGGSASGGSAAGGRAVDIGADGARTVGTGADTTGSVDDWLDGGVIADKRLELLFVCAHPAIDAKARTPLMLQTVLGFDAAQIAAAFAVSEASMAQRLVRAKRRIRDARIPFVVPGAAELATRLPAVLEAIYGAYAIDWQPADARPSAAPLFDPHSLAGEALYLASTLAAMLPDEPEALGLEALLLLSCSRAAARTSAAGEPVALDDQDPRLWDAALIDRGERVLRRAHALGSIGRFQLEAAIQSAHCDRARSATVDWAALVTLHRALVQVAPSLGARVALAATLGEAESPSLGLAELDSLATLPGIAQFQPAWATRAHLLARSGRLADARQAYDVAISLTAPPGIRTALERARDAL